MRLTFRQRILLTLICLGAVPTAVAVLGWGFTLRSTTPAAGARSALEAVGASGRVLLHTLDSTRLAPPERRALADHATKLNTALVRFQRAETFGRYYYAGLALVVFLAGTAFLYASVRLGGHLSRQLSRPIEELIGWTGHIRRHEALPPDRPRRGAPEFEALRTALREMADALDRARMQEIEAERLRAFRETARRVAHEMRNPLTPMRLAVSQLSRAPSPGQHEAVEVLIAETGRLEQLAREFTEFGRLPEGPAAQVDIPELLTELARTSLPPAMTFRTEADAGTPTLLGHYDPLRRAFGNILRNAVEACDGQGAIEIIAGPDEGAGVRVEIRDHGPGIPPELRGRLFDPYTTAKSGGTGLGLALARQTFDMHRGSVEAVDTPGGGATFVIRMRGR